MPRDVVVIRPGVSIRMVEITSSFLLRVSDPRRGPKWCVEETENFMERDNARSPSLVMKISDEQIKAIDSCLVMCGYFEFGPYIVTFPHIFLTNMGSVVVFVLWPF
jgi:hypothetical protein